MNSSHETLARMSKLRESGNVIVKVGETQKTACEMCGKTGVTHYVFYTPSGELGDFLSFGRSCFKKLKINKGE